MITTIPYNSNDWSPRTFSLLLALLLEHIATSVLEVLQPKCFESQNFLRCNLSDGAFPLGPVKSTIYKILWICSLIRSHWYGLQLFGTAAKSSIAQERTQLCLIKVASCASPKRYDDLWCGHWHKPRNERWFHHAIDLGSTHEECHKTLNIHNALIFSGMAPSNKIIHYISLYSII